MDTNFPPVAADPIQERLADKYAALRTRTAELAAALDRVPAKIDEATIDKAAGFVKQIKAAAKDAEAARKAEGDDFLKAKRTVDGFFTELSARLKEVADEVERRMQSYLRAKADEERRRREEEARKAREAAEAAAAEARRIREQEEAARRAAEEAERARIAALTPKVDPAQALAAQREAEERRRREEDAARERELEALQAARRAQEEADEAQRLAQAKAADLARTRGALGGTATLATKMDFEITDRVEAARQVSRYFDEAAIDKAMRAFMRENADSLKRLVAAGDQPLSGVRFFESYKARVA
jgi:hypothetical protein